MNNPNMRKLSLFIASSLDGYIAGPNDDLSFLQSVEQEGEDYGYAEFTSTIDTIILGRKTYDWVLNRVGSARHISGMRDVYVSDSNSRPNIESTKFYAGDHDELVERHNE